MPGLCDVMRSGDGLAEFRPSADVQAGYGFLCKCPGTQILSVCLSKESLYGQSHQIQSSSKSSSSKTALKVNHKGVRHQGPDMIKFAIRIPII